MAQALGAVRYLHRHRVIHRDLKLGNLFLAADGSVKARAAEKMNLRGGGWGAWAV